MLLLQLWATHVPPCPSWWRVCPSCSGRHYLWWSKLCLGRSCKCRPCHVSSWRLSTYCSVSPRRLSLLHVSGKLCGPCMFHVSQHLSAATSSPPGSLISFRLTPNHISGISLHFLTLSYGGGCMLGALIVQLAYLLSGGNSTALHST